MTFRGDSLWDRPQLAGQRTRNLRRALIVRIARRRAAIAAHEQAQADQDDGEDQP